MMTASLGLGSCAKSILGAVSMTGSFDELTGHGRVRVSGAYGGIVSVELQDWGTDIYPDTCKFITA